MCSKRPHAFRFTNVRTKSTCWKITTSLFLISVVKIIAHCIFSKKIFFLSTRNVGLNIDVFWCHYIAFLDRLVITFLIFAWFLWTILQAEGEVSEQGFLYITCALIFGINLFRRVITIMIMRPSTLFKTHVRIFVFSFFFLHLIKV